MGPKLMQVSADCHIGPTWDAIRGYLEQEYLEDYDRWIAQKRRIHDRRRVGREAELALQESELRPVPEEPEIMDPARRLAELDADGVAAEVLFPDPEFHDFYGIPFRAMFGFNAHPDRYSPELETAGERAYNRWLADFCSAAPEREIGLAQPNRFDMEECVRGLKWARDAGLRGIELPSADPDLPSYIEDHWEPLWSACEELELPVSFHGGTGEGAKGTILHEIATHPELGEMEPGEGAVTFLVSGGSGSEFSKRALGVFRSEVAWWSSRPIRMLFGGRVLARHPQLKCCFTEMHCDWIPRELQLLGAARDESILEIWDRQCFVGASLLSREEVGLRYDIGVENMMYGTDYPHPEGGWRRNREWLQLVFGDSGVTEDELRLMLGETAARVFGLDTKKLAAIVERIGLDVDDVLASPDPSAEDKFVGKRREPFRRYAVHREPARTAPQTGAGA